MNKRVQMADDGNQQSFSYIFILCNSPNCITPSPVERISINFVRADGVIYYDHYLF